ncbi:hypothetical protein [Flavilitoribacter nigricans]|uniref:hypothetical protein n=1 Tax=Flavilitoribacter nigricans TaxID=70997 RepID=UPI00117AB825|nr:hypothetical protein [Flavilitoribacter nigricans]
MEKETGRQQTVSRKLSRNFDPFVHIQTTDKVSLTYDRGKQGTFYVDGYENKPSGLIFYFLFLIALIAQAIFIAVLFDKMDERHWSYEK